MDIERQQYVDQQDQFEQEAAQEEYRTKKRSTSMTTELDEDQLMDAEQRIKEEDCE
jgi:hypothetical protein